MADVEVSGKSSDHKGIAHQLIISWGVVRGAWRDSGVPLRSSASWMRQSVDAVRNTSQGLKNSGCVCSVCSVVAATDQFFTHEIAFLA